MKVLLDPRVDKKVRLLSEKSNSQIVRVIELFEENEFVLTEKHLKKLSSDIWELRAGRWRLLFGLADRVAVVVSIFIKKTQKTPKKEIELAVKRIKEYI